jgi:hypothetical protein
MATSSLNYHNDAEMRVPMAEQLKAARREMRRLLLASENEEMRDAYYRALTLTEHEARRAVLDQVDDYGLALMLIREGADPTGTARAALTKHGK